MDLESINFFRYLHFMTRNRTELMFLFDFALIFAENIIIIITEVEPKRF